MRYNHHVWYEIERFDDKCWWARGRWNTIGEVQGKQFQCWAHFWRKDKALKCLANCPPGTRMTQYFYKRGERYGIEYEVD